MARSSILSQWVVLEEDLYLKTTQEPIWEIQSVSLTNILLSRYCPSQAPLNACLYLRQGYTEFIVLIAWCSKFSGRTPLIMYAKLLHPRITAPPIDPATTIQTRYMIMLLEYDCRIPFLHTCKTAVAQWMLLAGYLVVPGTFSSLQQSAMLKGTPSIIVHTIQNPPLLGIACIFFLVGVSVISWLAWRWRYNYLWLSKLFRSVKTIFLCTKFCASLLNGYSPTLLNALAGLLTTLINVYTAKDGVWSIMPLLTVIVTGLVALLSMVITAYYYFLSNEIKDEHEREMQDVGRLQLQGIRTTQLGPVPSND